MADFDFGDTELFDQFEEESVSKHIRFNNVDEEVTDEVQQRFVTFEATIESLNAENEELKRKLNILSRPVGIKISNSQTDGPLCQVLFGNNVVSKQHRQDIEDFISCLVLKHHDEQKRNDPESPAPLVKPHCASFVLEESYKVQNSSTSQQVKEAFSVVGSVLYFENFCVDKLGQPLLNENPQLTEGWDVPKYQQVFNQVITPEGQEIQIKEKRPRPCCFNCCSEDHQLRDCPEPKDMARINEKRKEFSQNSSQGNQRYHAEEVEERFAKYKPGKVSQELFDALGVPANSLPPFIYRMRELGYPPGWLKEAEMENSGLTLYDGKKSKDEDVPDEDDNNQSQISYDVSKLVDFPGFNVMAPPNVRDDYRSFGSVPMQPQYWKENFSAFLTNSFPTPGCRNKRRHTTELILGQTKKQRSSSDQHHESDMEIESDHDSSLSIRPDGFQFQPPPPPGAASPIIHPPLPLGTPPSTPTPPPLPKDTPPACHSPSITARGEGEESEDGLTLEELEEQQRLLWAALEKSDTTTNSDSDAGASVTPVPSSPSVCTPSRLDAEDDGDKIRVENPSHMYEVLSTPMSPLEERGVSNVYEDEQKDNGQVKHMICENMKDVQEDMSDIIVLDEVYEDSGSQDAANETENTPQVTIQESKAEEAGSSEHPVMNKVLVVPHRSKFAAGIIPFEDTPEFTEVAEATGVYLKIRDLLKGSPRNQSKNKN